MNLCKLRSEGRKFVFIAVIIGIVYVIGTNAARPIPEYDNNTDGGDDVTVIVDCFNGISELVRYPSMYEKARTTMACWMGKLASGPSPKGPGH
ncbi:hypothetical protein IHE45_05G048000 [Dioscorea alata]|uniref:Uncharacterized protein n=1 Tax=Dioscorea alata TaxID=55571 RepID=A0ACB7W140_DIOAL|nr:hypothetical protein IHE45_05G048000 [Dioscorea alata]